MLDKIISERLTVRKTDEVINDMLKNRKSFVLSVYPADTCWSDTDEPNFLNNMNNLANQNNLFYYRIGLLVYKKTDLYKQVKYAPTVIIVYKGKVIAYLDAESNEHLKYEKSPEEFNKWFKTYVNLNK